MSVVYSPCIGGNLLSNSVKTVGIFLIWFLLAPAVLGLKVGTYNIRYDTPGDVAKGNSWTQRAPIIASLIRFHDFDVLGTQEGLPQQMLDLQRLLPQYECASHGRNDGKLAGEHVGILYKKDSFDAIDTGFFWLSETPERPSKGWDAKFPRICTWVKLRPKGGGKTFCYFAVHLDHQGEVSRLEGIRLILREVDEISDGAPVILVGDFNVDQNNKAYQMLAQSGRLADSAKVAEVCYLLNGSTNGFNPNGETESRVDHVFVSTGTRVRRFGILTDSYRIPKITSDPTVIQSGNVSVGVKFKDHEARLPSDHFPILVETVNP